MPKGVACLPWFFGKKRTSHITCSYKHCSLHIYHQPPVILFISIINVFLLESEIVLWVQLPALSIVKNMLMNTMNIGTFGCLTSNALFWKLSPHKSFQIIHSHVILPKELAKTLPKSRLLTENEWRGIGVQQSRGWQHYALHRYVDVGQSIVLPLQPTPCSYSHQHD